MYQHAVPISNKKTYLNGTFIKRVVLCNNANWIRHVKHATENATFPGCVCESHAENINDF